LAALARKAAVFCSPAPPDHTAPAQLSKWSLDHRWDISEVSAEMVEPFKAKYNPK
jgi:hypothetical protein